MSSQAPTLPETALDQAAAWLRAHGWGPGRYLASRQSVLTELLGWVWAQGLTAHHRQAYGRALARLLPRASAWTYGACRALAVHCPPARHRSGKRGGSRSAADGWRDWALRPPRKSERRRPPEWEHGGGI